jgi:two-component system cell cycle response regulator DivK
LAKILIAEDNPLNREILARLLALDGHSLVFAEDGVEAVEQAHATQPDLIIMDMGMPRLNGFRATRQIKQDPATQAIPVIAFTAYAMEGEREKCLAVGCDEYETKPLDFKRLQDKIAALLNRPAVPRVPADDSGPGVAGVGDGEGELIG